MDVPLPPRHGSSVSTEVVDILSKTRGWVLFFSVVLWIGVGFMLLGGVAIVGLALVGGTMGEQLGAAMGVQEIGVVVVMGLVYLALAGLYIYPALKLGKFAVRISNLVRSPTQALLAAALDEQRAFWKFLGVLTLLMIVLYIAILGIALVAGIVGAAAAS